MKNKVKFKKYMYEKLKSNDDERKRNSSNKRQSKFQAKEDRSIIRGNKLYDQWLEQQEINYYWQMFQKDLRQEKEMEECTFEP